MKSIFFVNIVSVLFANVPTKRPGGFFCAAQRRELPQPAPFSPSRPTFHLIPGRMGKQNKNSI